MGNSGERAHWSPAAAAEPLPHWKVASSVGMPQHFASCLAKVLAGGGRLGCVVFEGVPEIYRVRIQTALEALPAGDSHPVDVTICSPSMREPIGPTLASHSIYAEFPFDRPREEQWAYIRAYSADPYQVQSLNKYVTEALEKLVEVTIRTASMQFRFPVRGSAICADGVTLSPSDRSLQLPGGEVFLTSYLGLADGTVTLDLSLDKRRRPWNVWVEKGVVVDIEPLETFSVPALPDFLELRGANVVELGIGTNPYAAELPYGCLFEKLVGTLHLGLDLPNAGFGITHVDARVLAPLPEPLQWILASPESSASKSG